MFRILPALIFLSLPAAAAERIVPAHEGALAAAVAAASPGEVLILASGSHSGRFEINKPLVLQGLKGAVVMGTGTGSVFNVRAPDVTIRGIEIRGSGSSHESIDSAIRLGRKAARAVIDGNRLIGNLYGVDIHGARDAKVTGNVIEGRRDHRVNDRGNGIYVWNAPGAIVEGNDVRWGRDGIFINTSKNNTFRKNRFRDLRFAVHYMYAHNSTVEGNISAGNDLGFAIMYSRRVRVLGNTSIGDGEHGIMMNYANSSVVRGNLVLNAANRCVFVYNAHKNRIENNRFEKCGIGIHFTAGSERNAVTGNAFVANRIQVKYAGSRYLDWSDQGRGNHWSEFAAFDIDGDGNRGLSLPPQRYDKQNHVAPARRPMAPWHTGSPAGPLGTISVSGTVARRHR